MKARRVMTSLLLLSVAAAADAREQIRIVGSPLVLAYAEPVAKRFALNRGRPVPSMEMTGAGTGFGMFCECASVKPSRSSPA